MNRANEALMMCRSEESQEADRETFVRNLGWLLSQTREGVECCELDGNHVVIYYKGDHVERVNIAHDSYIAIIRDVCKGI